MNRKIIIALIIVLLAVLVGLFAFSSLGNAKDDTAITFLTNSTLKNGDAVKFQLTDSNGNPIANEEITIAFEKNGTVENYSISTDSNGTGSLVLNDLDPGEYRINVTYNGSDKYNPSSAAQTLVVGEGTSDNPVESSDSSSSQQTSSSGQSSSSGSASIHYDENLNVYYNDQGIVVDPDGKHPMEVGSNYYDLLERSPDDLR